MGRIFQVDYERAFALCAELERILSEMESQTVALQGTLEPMGSDWVPHGAAVQAYRVELSSALAPMFMTTAQRFLPCGSLYTLLRRWRRSRPGACVFSSRSLNSQ